MVRRAGLQYRLTRAYLLQMVLISFATLFGVWVTAQIIERVLVRQALVMEAEHFWDAREQRPDIQRPNTRHLLGLIDGPGGDAIPSALRSLSPGEFARVELDDNQPIVYVEQRGEETLYLIFDEQRVSVLAFVFGMGLWLSARKRSRADALRRGVVRQRRMLVLGVLHGAFIYLGDILTMYAVVGWQLLGRLHMPWKRFRRHLRGAFVVAVMAKLLLAVVIFRMADLPLVVEGASLSSVRSGGQFLWLNASTYAVQQVSALIFSAPVLYFCMLCGVAAARRSSPSPSPV